MTNELLKRFQELFPMWKDDIVKWTPNKDGTVKIELSGKRFLIFSYWGDRSWRLETVRSYQREV